MNETSGKRLLNIMKGVVIIFLIVGVAVAFFVISDTLLFSPKTIWARTNADFKLKQKDVQILFLGMSDMRSALIPSEFDPIAFNYGSGGENYIETYYKLKACIDDTPNLEVVILSVAMASFSSDLSNRIRMKSYEFIRGDDFEELCRLKGYTVLTQKIKVFLYQKLFYVMERYRFREYIKNLIHLIVYGKIHLQPLDSGYTMRKHSTISIEEDRRKLEYLIKDTEPFDKDLMLYFQKILMLCRKNHIKVVTITLPQTNYFLQMMQPYVKMDQVYEKVILNNEYSPYITKHLDYLEAMPDNHYLFANGNHLNHNGALIISGRVSKEINQLMSGKKKRTARRKK